MHNAILSPNPMEELEKNKALAERQQLSKKERRFLKRQQKEKERFRHRRQRKLKKFLLVAIGVLIIGGGIFGGSWFLATRPPAPESAIIAKQGIHWHADLTIKILGQYQDISANIGIGITHRPIHTHEADGVIHMEFPSLVRENNIQLGRFFGIWGKKFSKDCILDKCNGLDGQVKMFVNGEPNYEFENYLMQDKDKIEIVFE